MPDLLRAWGDMLAREAEGSRTSVIVAFALFGALFGLFAIGGLVQLVSRTLARTKQRRRLSHGEGLRRSVER